MSNIRYSVTIISFQGGARSHHFDLRWKIGKHAAKSGGGGDIQPLVTAWAQILIGGLDEHGTKPATDSMPAQISAGNMNERGRKRTAAGLGTVGRRWAGGGSRGRWEGACLRTLTRVSYVFYLRSIYPVVVPLPFILPQSCFILEAFTRLFYSFTREANICTCNSCWKMVAPHYGVFSSK